MDETQQRCVEAFSQWLAGLPVDARGLLLLLADESAPEVHRRWAATAVGYLVKSLDLIPEGAEDLVYTEDAFVLRVAAARAVNAVEQGVDEATLLGRLARETELIQAFLGSTYPRLSAFVATLAAVPVQGFPVEALVGQAEPCAELGAQVEHWASHFCAPVLEHPEMALVKLKAFLDAKLP